MAYKPSDVVDLTADLSTTEDSEFELPPVEIFLKSPHKPKPSPAQTTAVNASHSFPARTANLSSSTGGNVASSFPPYAVPSAPSATPTSSKLPKKGTFGPTSKKTLKHKSSIDSHRLKAVGQNGSRETQAKKRRRLHPPNPRSPDRLNTPSIPQTGDRSHGSSSRGYGITHSNGPGPYDGQNRVIITSTADMGATGLEFIAPAGFRSERRSERLPHKPKPRRPAAVSASVLSTKSSDSDEATDALQAFKPRSERRGNGSKERHHKAGGLVKPSVPPGSRSFESEPITSEDDDRVQTSSDGKRPRKALDLGTSMLSPKGRAKDPKQRNVAPRPHPNSLHRQKHPPMLAPASKSPIADVNDLLTPTEIDLSMHFHVSSPKDVQEASAPIKHGKGLIWTEEEDRQIIYLRTVKNTPWPEAAKLFPQRTPGALATRYSNLRNSQKLVAQYSLVTTHATVDHTATPLASRYVPAAQDDVDHVSDSVSTPMDLDGVPSSEDSVLGGTPSYTPVPVTITQNLKGSVVSGTRSRTPEPTLKHKPTVRPRGRPRRVTQEVNYAAQQRLRPPRASEVSTPVDDTQSASPSRLTRMPSESEDLQSEDLFTNEVIGLPNQVDYHREAALISIGTTGPAGQADDGNMKKYPYLSSVERSSMRLGLTNGEWNPRLFGHWSGSVIHVDFQVAEMEVLEKAIIYVLGTSVPRSVSVRKRIQQMLMGIPDNKLYQISWEARRGRRLTTRSRESVEAFLMDAAAGRLEPFSHIERVGNVLPKRIRSSMSSLLRQRELGSDSRQRWAKYDKPGSDDIRQRIFDTFGPAYSFTGMSHDVLSVAWHPDGQRFAAGAACVVDADSMQYNRPNNLLIGDTLDKTLREIPHHHVTRPRAESGVNSRHSMHVSQDPRLFTTISMVEFSDDGRYMFSAGYDKVVRVYKTRDDKRELDLSHSLNHKAPVDMIATSKDGLLATACQRDQNPIKVLRLDSDIISPISFKSQKASERQDLRIMPRALKFEPTEGNLLLAGFGANTKDDGLDTVGEICLWDVSTQQRLEVYGGNRNVFDLAFNPRLQEGGLFAVGCVAGSDANRSANSVVRLYDLRTKYSKFVELECPARDMNDVVYCPYDDVYLAAGCTSGDTYVWDIRRPDGWIYTLSHGEPLTPLDGHQPRELLDTGVRFCSWGDSARRLYTGSSDGVVKSWDITRAPADVFVSDLVTLNTGVMSAAFSPDKTSLLVGEVNGSVNVLELGREDRCAKDVEPLRLIPANGPSITASHNSAVDPASGVAIAKDLVLTRQMNIVPLGGLPIRQAVQGTKYSGPYDTSEDATALREQSDAFQQKMSSRHDTPQCDIAACVNSITKLTLEEAGDSGRSKDRIPDSLREAWKAGSGAAVVPGKSKCSHCGRPARPSIDDDAEALCERCSFDCLHCGNRAVVAHETDMLWCLKCDRRWDIGVLGYEPVRGRRDIERSAWKERGMETLSLAGHDDGENATLGDELNDLASYYHSLWADRPAGPI
ncbi:uncharacterized protein BDZ99DRAFT_519427 [Mytilinidion resinicola]|uniref:Myb-like domain-containing protein n=1 Tax=Mytilinidion resinicola TaxID=574789 RepID=A0A6A6YQD8_9PEZI|nr:uncharacterized protein BDZ99DRAFT_519427 [Mytilinidion resinicola]KAF2810743.1 hypothetical protein BDZ99DRAFT_519427 [Mytilinidion resinicola]